MKNNKMAVILVDYNGLDLTIDCIDSIHKTSNYKDIDIIVVDNASKIDEASILKDKYPNIITFRSEDNKGFSGGNNIGIKYALDNDYKYICLLNNDTEVDKDMFRLLIDNRDNNHVSIPKMYYCDKPNTIWYGGGYINKKTGNAVHYHIDELDNNEIENSECSFATGCCVMFKSETIRKVGLLDESYFMYCEDTEYSIRLNKENIKIVYVPKAKLWHKVSSSSGEDSPFTLYYCNRNRLNLVKKYRSFFNITAYPFSLVSRYIRMMECKDKKKKEAIRQAILDHFKGITGKVDYKFFH